MADTADSKSAGLTGREGSSPSSPTISTLTVTEFMNLPRHAGVRQELHHGKLFETALVKSLHTKMQDAFVEALNEVLDPAYKAIKEFPFRPLPEFEAWVADVAIVEKARWEATPEDDYFAGTPLLVIEILSPSNTASEMLDREQTCLSSGAIEFWLLDPKRRTVRTTSSHGQSRSYNGQTAISPYQQPAYISPSPAFFQKQPENFASLAALYV